MIADFLYDQRSLSNDILEFQILAPTTYIFFASEIPVISFGEQLERNTDNPHLTEFMPSWRFANGMFASLVLSFGLLLTALRSRKARSWRYGTGWLHSLIADYRVPIMVVVWTAVSHIPSESVPKGIPRRLLCPNPWSPGAYQNWTVIKPYVSSSLY
ncbi:hypothetical protein CQW23_27606 [Capsicum baccatum]|uniref:Uncharacterized protein n=1 Tax=Capsicum baccatum TaxID=33114 RepID=A0A2G2VEB3_CAPBA|nr:hypothetical protein CQW23_27606 [Capsicum baccatum]